MPGCWTGAAKRRPLHPRGAILPLRNSLNLRHLRFQPPFRGQTIELPGSAGLAGGGCRVRQWFTLKEYRQGLLMGLKTAGCFPGRLESLTWPPLIPETVGLP